MTPETFCEHFATFADAPNGIEKLRELILQLAVQGKLVPQDLKDEPASEVVRRINAARGMKNTAHDSAVATEGLPRGWSLVRMGQITDHRLGKMLDKAKNKGELFPYLRNTNVQWWRFALDDLKEMRFVPDELREYEVRIGDLLVCEGGEPGRCAVWNDTTHRLVFQKAIHRVRPLEGISPYFLAIRLRLDALTGVLDRQFTGATITHFTGQELARYAFPLPPLAEQRRIVEKVDQLLGLCDELAARQAAQREKRQRLVGATLDRLVSTRNPAEFPTHAQRLRNHFDQLFDTPTTIPQLRQTILQLAVQGQLVPQEPNDEPPALRHFDDTSVNIDAVPFTVPKCWRWFQVSEVFEVSGGITKNPKRTPVKNHFPYLRVANVQRGRLKLEEIERFELAEGELERWRLEPSDILVVEGNGSEDEIGRCALWRGEISDCVHQNHIIRCRPQIDDIQDFVLLFLNSPAGIAEMKERAITTSGLYSLSVGKIRSLAIPLPPLAEQKRIVTKVTELLSLCDALEAKLTQAESASTQLLSAAVHHLLNGQEKSVEGLVS